MQNSFHLQDSIIKKILLVFHVAIAFAFTLTLLLLVTQYWPSYPQTREIFWLFMEDVSYI